MSAGVRAAMLVALATVVTLPISGQSTGDAPTVLLLPAGTRALGLGNAFVAGDGPEALFYNPAQIGARGSVLSIARFGGAATLGSFAAVGKAAGNNVAIGVRFLDFGARVDGFPSPAGSLSVRGPVDATSLDAMVAAEKSWIGIRLGGAAHYVSEMQQGVRAAGMLFDAGASRDVAGISVGLSVQNLGADLALHGVVGHPPTRVTLGGSKEGLMVGTFFDLAVAAAVTRERDGRLVPGAGLALTWEPVSGWTVTGRAGVRRGDPGDQPGASPVTFGGSLGLDALTLDYAYQAYHGVAGGAHRFAVRIR